MANSQKSCHTNGSYYVNSKHNLYFNVDALYNAIQLYVSCKEYTLYLLTSLLTTSYSTSWFCTHFKLCETWSCCMFIKIPSLMQTN